MQNRLDVGLDFRSETPPGKDADTFSPTLRRYHKILWSKPLPNGFVFTLDDSGPHYLYHRSELGEFILSSDAAIPTFLREPRMSHIIHEIPPDERETFIRISYTIGGMMLFPGNRIGRKNTINGARGFHPLIKDRFDLTVECIRRHYRGEPSPLKDTLGRYAEFFRLFGGFRGYVEHFLLQDLVTHDCSAVRFFASFENFATSPLPTSIDVYMAYRQTAVAFIEARNRRILQNSIH